jgi:hypothetical protein
MAFARSDAFGVEDVASSLSSRDGLRRFSRMSRRKVERPLMVFSSYSAGGARRPRSGWLVISST